jgi:AmmeMemoRadiSam system protein A
MTSQQKRKAGIDLGLTDAERQELRRIARVAIEYQAVGKPVPPSCVIPERLKEPGGAFVSLYKKGMLRGCIGSVESDKPLYKTVEETAQAAAAQDPRFRPVEPEELSSIEVEISALTPLRRIQDPAEIQVGPHGILVRKKYHSGLLLPQVATERDWDRMTFLRETCRKAGLSEDAWQDEDTLIYVFSADVFR